MTENGPDNAGQPAGIPRWLIYGFLAKLALVVAITAGVVWWASR